MSDPYFLRDSFSKMAIASPDFLIFSRMAMCYPLFLNPFLRWPSPTHIYLDLISLGWPCLNLIFSETNFPILRNPLKVEDRGYFLADFKIWLRRAVYYKGRDKRKKMCELYIYIYIFFYYP